MRPTKRGERGSGKMVAVAIAPAVERIMEAKAHFGASLPGQKTARVSGRKMPPPRRAMER